MIQFDAPDIHRKAAEAAELDRVMMMDLMRSPAAIRFLGQLLERSGVLRPAFVHGGAAAARSTDYREGERGIGLWAVDLLLDADEMGLVRLMQAQADERLRATLENGEASDER